MSCNRVVRAAQRAVTYAAGHADHLDIGVRISHVHFDLFGGARRVEARRAAHEGDEPAVREPSGDAHRVLFRDAAFDELFRQRVHELVQRDGAPAVGRKRKDAPVLPREMQKLLRKRLSECLHAHSTPFTPSAWYACATCSALGT